jgi:hypothetical protein
MTIADCPDLALPPGADPEFTDEWEAEISVPTGWYRTVWSRYFSERLWIRAVATQYLDGTLDTDKEAPRVFLDDDCYTPQEAREAAAALIAAADLADQWAGIADASGALGK